MKEKNNMEKNIEDARRDSKTLKNRAILFSVLACIYNAYYGTHLLEVDIEKVPALPEIAGVLSSLIPFLDWIKAKKVAKTVAEFGNNEDWEFYEDTKDLSRLARIVLGSFIFAYLVRLLFS